MKKVLISIDHKWRDLPGYVYAGILLEQLGHQVYYVRNGLQKYYIPAIKPDLVLMIHLFEEEQRHFANELKKQGIKVALMPTEGIPTLEKYRYFASGAGNDLSSVDLHFVWNEPMAETLSQNSTIDKEKIIVVGVPRFDFYRKPLSSLLMTKQIFCQKYKLNPDYPIITFATNFTQASFYTKNKDFFLSDAQRLGYKTVLDDLFGNFEDIPKRDFESRETLTSAFVQLVKDFPKINFVLKLHPSEDHQFYHEVIKTQLSNYSDRVKILSNEYIWDVLNVTDIELKRSCTTGVEAWLLEKPTIEMKLNPNEWYFSQEHASGSNVVGTYKELADLIDYYISGHKIDTDLLEARSRFIEKWCFNVDGQATKRMVEQLDNLLKKEQSIKNVKRDWKKKVVFYGLQFGDHFIHDLRIYGLWNTITQHYVDRLGRDDKYFHKLDVNFWKNNLIL